MEKPEPTTWIQKGKILQKDGLGSMQQGICEGKVFAPELKRNELVTLEFNDGSVDDYYADENGYASGARPRR